MPWPFNSFWEMPQCITTTMSSGAGFSIIGLSVLVSDGDHKKGVLMSSVDHREREAPDQQSPVVLPRGSADGRVLQNQWDGALDFSDEGKPEPCDLKLVLSSRLTKFPRCSRVELDFGHFSPWRAFANTSAEERVGAVPFSISRQQRSTSTRHASVTSPWSGVSSDSMSVSASRARSGSESFLACHSSSGNVNPMLVSLLSAGMDARVQFDRGQVANCRRGFMARSC